VKVAYFATELAMTLKESILTWARRQAEHDNVEYVDLLIQSDGFVYAMPENRDAGAVAWWPLPYLGHEGEAAFAAGELTDGN
jgi:hypothetical protein